MSVASQKWQLRFGHRNLEHIKKFQIDDLPFGIIVNKCSHNAAFSSSIKTEFPKSHFLNTHYT